MGNFFSGAMGGGVDAKDVVPHYANEAGGAASTAVRKAFKGGGFTPYGGDFVMPFGDSERAILDQFLQADLPMLRNSLGDIAQQDALGRAEMLLQPSKQRSIQSGINSIRERMGANGNLFSSNLALEEGRAVGDIESGFNQSLAALLPQMQAQRMAAAQQLLGQTGSALGLASIPRNIQQQDLNARYQEFLRTNPFGGPLQALLGLSGNAPSLGSVQPGMYGPSMFDSLMQMGQQGMQAYQTWGG